MFPVLAKNDTQGLLKIIWDFSWGLGSSEWPRHNFSVLYIYYFINFFNTEAGTTKKRQDGVESEEEGREREGLSTGDRANRS